MITDLFQSLCHTGSGLRQSLVCQVDMGILPLKAIGKTAVDDLHRAVFPCHMECSVEPFLQLHRCRSRESFHIDRQDTKIFSILFYPCMELFHRRSTDRLDPPRNSFPQQIFLQMHQCFSDLLRTENHFRIFLGSIPDIFIEPFGIIDQCLKILTALIMIIRGNPSPCNSPIRPDRCLRHQPHGTQRRSRFCPLGGFPAVIIGGAVLKILGIAIREKNIGTLVKTLHPVDPVVGNDAGMVGIVFLNDIAGLFKPEGIQIPAFRFIRHVPGKDPINSASLTDKSTQTLFLGFRHRFLQCCNGIEFSLGIAHTGIHFLQRLHNGPQTVTEIIVDLFTDLGNGAMLPADQNRIVKRLFLHPVGSIPAVGEKFFPT